MEKDFDVEALRSLLGPLAQGFTEAQLFYADCLARGDPRKKKDLARLLGVTDRTLRLWQAKPGFWQIVYALARHHAGRYAPSVFQALVRECLKGSPQALRLYFEIVGGFVPAQSVEVRSLVITGGDLPPFVPTKVPDGEA